MYINLEMHKKIKADAILEAIEATQYRKYVGDGGSKMFIRVEDLKKYMEEKL